MSDKNRRVFYLLCYITILESSGQNSIILKQQYKSLPSMSNLVTLSEEETKLYPCKCAFFIRTSINIEKKNTVSIDRSHINKGKGKKSDVAPHTFSLS